MPIYWPASLPSVPTTRGQSYGAPKGAIKATSMEIGPGKRRRRTTAAAQDAKFSLHGLTADQRAVFEAFFKDTLAHGTFSFLISDPVTGAYATYRFLPTNPYSFADWGNKFVLSLSLEKMP